jgi:hypothetical protein
MIKVEFLKDGEFVSVKEFNTPASAFVYALEEADNLYGPPKKKGGERTFSYVEGLNGSGSITVVDPRWCGSPLRESEENKWMSIQQACHRHGSFSPGVLRTGLESGRWKNLVEGVEYAIAEGDKQRRITVCYPLIFESIGDYTPSRVFYEVPDDLVERYEKAGSMYKLARETGIPESTIRKYLRAHDIDTSRKRSA